MTDLALTPHASGTGTVLLVRAQPGARKNAVLGTRAGALRVAVTAPPERGKANDAIAALLATTLGLKASHVELMSGETSRDKRFLIANLTPDDLRARITTALPS